ncbi:MAG: hypothetical protein HY043_18030 [Verrucomicrobia bacterium]|nr:hypothetical protein [Verrucomicrobiota bacterium]
MATVFFVITKLPRDIADSVCLAILLVGLALWPVLMALLGALKIFRRETTMKKIAIYLCVSGGAIVYSIFMERPLRIFLPVSLSVFTYGLGACIGFYVQRRNVDAVKQESLHETPS